MISSKNDLHYSKTNNLTCLTKLNVLGEVKGSTYCKTLLKPDNKGGTKILSLIINV